MDRASPWPWKSYSPVRQCLLSQQPPHCSDLQMGSQAHGLGLAFMYVSCWGTEFNLAQGTAHVHMEDKL